MTRSVSWPQPDPSPGDKAALEDRPALLLIGHGSRSEAGVAQYFAMADAVTSIDRDLMVGTGFIELARPALPEAIDELASRGAHSVVGVPLVLLGAGHLKNDGPAALAHGRQHQSHITFSYARQLGLHPSVLDTVGDRISETLATGNRSPADETMVILVGRGSSDPDANADLYKAARLLSDSRGLPLVEPAFVSLTRPSVTEALDRAVRLGARRVAVVPYFLFTGILPERIKVQAAEWSSSHPEVNLALGGEMGPDPRIAALIFERYREAIGHHPPAMNCDMCLYRQALPGYEAKAGLSLAASAHDHDSTPT